MAKPKNYEEFLTTLKQEAPSPLWPEALRALWWDAKGNWEQAHNIAQDISSTTGNWIHAYLHRQEGDRWNAGYWYQRAARAYPEYSLKEERQALVLYIIAQ